MREAAQQSAPGRFLADSWEALSGESASLVRAPFRLLILIPLDAELASESEAIAAAVLGTDPVPRAIGVLLPKPGSSGVPSRAIPEWFALGDSMRFLELRAPDSMVANPRSGVTSISTGASSDWAAEFRNDVIAHLTDPELFDAAWSAIPENRPAAVGLRIISLGAGRARAVADLAVRLSEELAPNREPDTGKDLPKRWEIDERLYPIHPPYPADPTYVEALPMPIRGLAAVRQGNPLAIVSRTIQQYEEAVLLGLSMLKNEPIRLRALLDAAERTQEDGPYLDAIGAAALEKEFPSAVFGDSLAREYAEKEDAAAKVGILLNGAADSQADGLSAVLLAHWFNTDADAVRPAGLRALSSRLQAPEQAWSQLARAIEEIEPETAPSRSWLPWLFSFATGGPEMSVRQLPASVAATEGEPPASMPEAPAEEPAAASEVPQEAEPPAVEGESLAAITPEISTAMSTESTAAVIADIPAEEAAPVEQPDSEPAPEQPMLPPAPQVRPLDRVPVPGEEPWRLPPGLKFIFGSFIWRSRFRAYTFVAATVALLFLVIVQAISDLTGVRLVNATLFGLSGADSQIVMSALRWIAVNAIGYLVMSMLGAFALAQWADAFRFHEIPEALSLLRADARAIVQSEAGRIGARREYARVSSEAAATLLEGTQRGSDTARAFGEAVDVDGLPEQTVREATAPHRRSVGDDVIAGTDAAGIYRVYRLYVIALRQLFALSLVSAVKERWPRIRGTYWKETRNLVADEAASSLQKRLTTVLNRGLLKGDLLRDGIDPAEQVAARIWADPDVRSAALQAMTLDNSDAMPILASPAENRLLDLHAASGLVVSIPSTLEDLLESEGAMPKGTIVASRSLEEVAVFRFYPYQENIYRVEGGPTGEVGMTSE